MSFHASGVQTWSAATLNYPVSSGDGLWTEPGATATVDVGASQIVLSDSTEFEIGRLDPTTLGATQPQGEVFLSLPAMQPGQNVIMETPRGTVTIAASGQYEIAAGDSDHPTIVAVLAGAADISGTGVSLHVPAGQAATIDGTTKLSGTLAPLVRDAFLTLALTKVAPLPSGQAVPAVVAAMTGCSVLAASGTWQATPQYGTVWYPKVAAGWRPYRDGHWAWVAPWGWTWIGDEAWAFAPSHYGRWVQINQAWAWAPDPYAASGRSAYPVYAPALVSFFGIGAAAGALASVGAFSHVGWVPLAPGEAYQPWYRHSEAYLRGINVRDVSDPQAIRREPAGIAAFRNHDAATVADAATLEHGQRIGPQAHGLDAREVAEVHPLHAEFARPANLAVPPARQGPEIRPERAGAVSLRAPGPGIVVPRPGEAPALRAAEPARPGEPIRPGEAIRQGEAVRPGEAVRAAEPARPGEPAHPGEPPRPQVEAQHPAAAEAAHQAAERAPPHVDSAPHQEAAHPAPAPHQDAAHAAPVPHPAAAAHAAPVSHPPPAPHVAARVEHPAPPRPAPPHVEARAAPPPRPAPPQHHAAPPPPPHEEAHHG